MNEERTGLNRVNEHSFITDFFVTDDLEASEQFLQIKSRSRGFSKQIK